MAMMRWMLTGLRMAVWLGWQVESNWTDPLLFAVYSFVRPLAGVLILFFMFIVLSGGQTGPMLYFFLVGSALWPYVVNSLQGTAFTVVEDREEYRTLRYLYLTPVPYTIYLVGRAIAKGLIATIAVVITFAFAIVALGLPLDPAVMNVPYLVASFLLGFLGLWATGLMVAGLSLNLTQHAWSLPEAVGGALYLLCGAIFPITQLPEVLRVVGSLFPVTYWLEAIRRGLLGPGVSSFPSLSNEEVFLRLLLATVAAVIVGFGVFAWGERLAKSSGNLDRQSSY